MGMRMAEQVLTVSDGRLLYTVTCSDSEMCQLHPKMCVERGERGEEKERGERREDEGERGAERGKRRGERVRGKRREE